MNQFTRRVRNGLTYYVCLPMERLRIVQHAFSTRHGGVSPLPENSLNLSHVSWDASRNVEENRRRFLAALNLENAELATVSQVHSDRLYILSDDAGREHSHPQADALATRRSRTPVAVQVADCFPVLMLDPRTLVIAAVHAGWRGTAARIVSKTVQQLKNAFGVDPSDLLAAIGPGIRSCCFEVGQEVHEAFEAAYPGAGLSAPQGGGRRHLVDLTLALRIQFQECGVQADRVFDMGACTRCRVDEFFSYRAEGQHSGRMMGAISLQP